MDTARVSARLVSAVLARNEAAPDRYLRRVIARLHEISDEVILLDDESTDDTASLARSLGCVVYTREDPGGFWGANEVPARKELWELATRHARDGWVLIADADMLLEGDPRPLCTSWEAASWAFPLADLWQSEDTFRVDGPWGFGPSNPRPWLFRPRWSEFAPVPFDFAPTWPEGCIHVGHAPANWHQHHPTFAAPPDVFYKHLGYVTTEHRRAKAAQYASIAHQLNDFQRAHAASIADE